MAFIHGRQLVKQPYEEWPIDLDFGRSFSLPPGARGIIACEAFAIKWQRRIPDVKTDATEEILQSTTPIILPPNKTAVRIHVKGGLNDHDYQITVRVEFDNGSKLEEELFIRVRED